MNEPQLNPQQLAAAHLIDRHVILSAGAGCGKTSTLVERFMHVLETASADVSEIAAITFTEKAANELKGRVHQRLQQLASSSQSAGVRQAWRKALFAVEVAQIGTIHAFSADILREYAVRAAIDPGFAVLEDAEAGSLAARAVRNVLFAAVESGDPAAMRLLQLYEFNALSDMLVDSLARREDVAVLSARLEIRQADLERVARLLRSRALEVVGEWAAEALSSQKFERAISRLGASSGPSGDRIEERRFNIVMLHRSLQMSKAADVPGILLSMYREINLQGGTKRWGDGLAAVKESMDDLRSVLKPLTDVLGALDAEKWDERAAQIRDFVCLHDASLLEYRRIKRQAGGLDFDDLLVLARDLVTRDASVARALADRYKFILVDEFQDTDTVQYELVSAIAEKGANLFVVGDAQQSIYAFRGARVEVFSDLRAKYAGEGRGEVMRLAENYRSLGSILAFVNILFTRLMPAGSKFGYRTSHEPLAAARPAGPGRVELIVSASDRGLPYARRIEAQAIAARVREIVDSGLPAVYEKDADGREKAVAPKYSDVAILFRSMGSVGVYERELRAAGIPYYTVAGSTFYLRQEVKDLVNLLRFIVDGDDSLSLVAALRSPLFGVSDDALAELAAGRPLADYFSAEADPAKGGGPDAAAFRRAVLLVRRLSAVANRVGVQELVEAIFEATGFPAAVAMLFGGTQRVANVFKLRDAARAFDRRLGGTLEDFVKVLGELEESEARESEALVEEERADVVRLMTVHNSKGLEFPIVIVADSGRRRKFGRARGSPLQLDRGLGISLSGGREGQSAHYEVVKKIINDRDEAEEARILFVAATRARDHLIISGSAGKRGDFPAKADGWAGSILDAMGIDLAVPGDRDFDGVTIEYSCPSSLAAGSRYAGAPALLALHDRIVKGAPLPEAPRAEDAGVLARSAPAASPTACRDRFTATEIADFARCPLRWELVHLRRVPADFVIGGEGSGRVPGHLVGTLLHEVLEKAGRRERLADALERVLGTSELYAARPADLRAECLPILERFEQTDLYRLVAAAADAARERQFSFLLGDYLIEGKIDAVLDGRIVDFKSDDVPADEAAAYAEYYRSQMDVYALAHERLTGRPPAEVTLYFLRAGLPVTWPYGAGGLAAAGKRVLETIERIRAGGPFAADRGPSCRCEHKTVCALIAGRRAAARPVR